MGSQGVKCYRHFDTPAVESCDRCANDVCDICAKPQGAGFICPDCLMASGRRKRSLSIAALLGVALVAVALFMTLKPGQHSKGGGGGQVPPRMKVWSDHLKQEPCDLDTVIKLLVGLREAEYPVRAKNVALRYVWHCGGELEVFDKDYGEHSAEIYRLEIRLAKETCSRSKTQQLLQAYVNHGSNRRAVERGQRFLKACRQREPPEKLLWKIHYAYRQLSEWEQSIAIVTRLIEIDPHDHDYRWWRGRDYLQLDKLDEAARDYRQSLALMSCRNDELTVKLAGIYKKLRRPCDELLAYRALLTASRRPDCQRSRVEWDEQVLVTAASEVNRLYRQCTGNTKGRLVLPIGRDERSARAQVRINDKTEATFLLDTGATTIAISRAFATRAGISLDGARIAFASTAGGIKMGRIVTLKSVQLGSLRVDGLEAMVLDELGGDGLLGMNFLMRYKLTFDRENNKVILESQ